MLPVNQVDAHKVGLCKFTGIFFYHPFLQRSKLSDKHITAQDMAVKPFGKEIDQFGKNALLFLYVIYINKVKRKYFFPEERMLFALGK